MDHSPLAALALLIVAAHCAPLQPASSSASRNASSPQPDNPEVTVDRTIVFPHRAASVGELMAEASKLEEQGESLEAAARYERIVELDPLGPHAESALFRAAMAHEAGGDRSRAALRFAEVAQRFPEGRRARNALLRSIRLEVFLERFERAADLAGVFEQRYPEPMIRESVVILSARALSLLERNEMERASYLIEKGRSVIEREGLARAGALPRDLAQLYYALGELRRLRGEATRLDVPLSEFAAQLERRCQLLLDAQSAYSDTMRAYDSHWSLMAGYRVGELYESLHRELMALPPPSAATNDRKRLLFEGAMRLRYSILLEKGLAMMEHTRDMGERNFEQSAWMSRVLSAQARMKRALERENQVLLALPFSKAELRAALDRVAEGAAQNSAPNPPEKQGSRTAPKDLR